MKVDRITKAKPSNYDLANQGNQLHDCLEAHVGETKREFRAVKKDIKDIKEALHPKGHKAAGLSTPRVAFLRTVGATSASVTGIAVLYKLLVALWPSLTLAAKAVDHFLRSL